MNPDLKSLWESCIITDPSRFYAPISAINKARIRYEEVSASSGVPWQVIGIIHQREGSGNFRTHLHNGDPLSARTVNVPKGRPLVWLPPSSWEASAHDALACDELIDLTWWADVPTTLYRMERYNGLGYRAHGILSPYLWAGTNHYTSGKFTADGHFDPQAVDQQPGAVGILKMLNYGAAPIPTNQVATTATPPPESGIVITPTFGPQQTV